MQTNVIYNENCFDTIKRLNANNERIDYVVTSPPYNTDSRNLHSERARKNHEGRYDIHQDTMTCEQYVEWTVNLFNGFDSILNKNGAIIYNLNYGTGDSITADQMIYVINGIISQTNFMLADILVWKKKSALPNNVSKNKMTRIVEFVYVFCRKNENKSFNSNKEVSSISSKGQTMYKNYTNFFEAPNNDGSCQLNKATYSSDFVKEIFNRYVPKDSIVYDPFMGTGTTALASKQTNRQYIGSELSSAQCEFAKNRLKQLTEQTSLF